MRATSDAVVVEFPLRGEWVAVRTPAHRVPSHGTDMLGQRYAFDFVRPDHRRGLRLHPGSACEAPCSAGGTCDYYGWGQPIHAALDGVVVAADPEPERVQMVGELAHTIWATVGFDPPGASTRWPGTMRSCRGPAPTRCSPTWPREPCR